MQQIKKTNLDVDDVIIFWKPQTVANQPKEKSYVMAKRVLGVPNDKYYLISSTDKNNKPNYQLSEKETTNTANSIFINTRKSLFCSRRLL